MTVRTLSAFLAELFQCREGDPEMAAILFADHRSHIIDTRIIKGSPDMLILPVRQILRDSLTMRARQVVMIHTHPSGDPRPSEHDVAATRLLCAHLRRQRQRLIDHIILSRNLYFSFRANHML